MQVKFIVDEDFINYKKPSMFIGAMSCNGKCFAEIGLPANTCQNYMWRESATYNVGTRALCERYLTNKLTDAIVIGGLEPFDQWEEIVFFLRVLRFNYSCSDDVVIYTGYNKDEVVKPLEHLRWIPNLTVKFGRYIPSRPARFDEILGVQLASDNQYAERIS